VSASEYILLMQGDLLPALGVVLLFSLACPGIGGALTKRCDGISFALGMVVLGLVFAAVFPIPRSRGALAAVYFSLVPPALFGGYLFVRALRQNAGSVICGSLLFAFFLGSALLPPYSWDEQVYQVELLSRYLRNGSQAVLPDNPYSAWPGFLQSFLLGGCTLGGLDFPRIFNALTGAVLAGTLFSALSAFGRKTGIVFTAAAVLSPLFLVVNRAVYAENTTALFVAAGMLALYRMRKTPKQACALAGVFAGAAVAVKLTSGGAALALLLLCAWDPKRRRYLPLFFLGAAAAALPFFFRVWACTGNPVYPFAAAVFGTSRAVEAHHLLLGSARYGMGPLYGTVFGWIATAFGGKLYDGIVTGLQQLVMLAVFFLGLHFSFREKRGKMAAVFFAALAVMYLFWGLTAQQTRFLLPAFIGLAGLAAFSRGLLPVRCRGAVLICVLAGTLLSPTLWAHFRHFPVAWRIAGTARREPLRFLAFAQKDPVFIRALEAVGRTPRDSRILLLYEKRGLYVPRRHAVADPGFQEKYFTSIPGSPEKFVQALGDSDYLLIGSEERNVDLQESGRENRERLLALAAGALAEGRLSLVFSGDGDGCRLLKIERGNTEKK